MQSYIKLDNFFFGESCLVMGKQVEADVADVGHVVDPAMMLPLVSERENSEHVHHASHFLLYRNYLEEIVLDVYVPLEVLSQLQSLGARLQL